MEDGQFCKVCICEGDRDRNEKGIVGLGQELRFYHHL